MAKSPTKQSLTATTAHVPSADALVTTSHNQPPALPTMQYLQSIAATGFGFKNDADKLNGRATQTIAYTCMALHNVWLNAGPPEGADKDAIVPDLAGTIHKRNAANKTLLFQWFVDALVGPKTDTGMKDERQAKLDIERANKTMLVRRGMNMAAILLTDGVKHTDYDTKTNTFVVPARMLIMKGWIGLGRMSNPDALIHLDRRSCAGVDGEQFKKWTASIDQLNKAVRSQHGIKASRAVKTELKDLSADRLSNEVQTGTLIAALREALTKLEDGKELRPDRFTPQQFNDWNDIAFMLDNLKRTDAWKAYFEHGITPDAKVITGVVDGKYVEHKVA